MISFIMRSVDDIINDVLKHGKFKNDAALARELGVAPNTISMWRKRGIFDYKLIVTWCDAHNIPSGWILTGQITVRQEDIGGQIVTRPANEPGLYQQDQAFREMQVKYGTLPPDNMVAVDYSSKIAKRILNADMAALVNDLIDILESDDTIIKTAITENLKAFKESVGRKKKLDKAPAETDFKTQEAKREKY